MGSLGQPDSSGTLVGFYKAVGNAPGEIIQPYTKSPQTAKQKKDQACCPLLVFPGCQPVPPTIRLTVQDGPLIVDLCVFQVGIFNGRVIVRHKDLLEKLDSEGTLAHTSVPHHHQLVGREVVAGDSTGCHIGGRSDLGRQEMENQGLFFSDFVRKQS